MAPSSRLWNKDFTLMVIGQIISLFGNIIFRFALSMYILDTTGSGTIFGSIAAIAMLPTILMTPVGGMIADRLNRRNIMVVLDFLTAGLLALFGFVFQMKSTIPIIAATLVMLSIIQAFYTPSVQASVPMLQRSDNLVRANAIVNQVAMVANLTGPILGGLLFGLFGLKIIVYVSVGCFALSAVLEIFMTIPFVKPAVKSSLMATIKSDFSDSIRFVTKDSPMILRIMLLIAMVNFFVTSLILVGMPYLVRIMLGLSSELYGLAAGLMAGAGILGGFICTLIAKRFQVKRLYIMLIGCGVFLLPIGIALMLKLPELTIFVVIVVCCMLVQLCGSIFSIFALSVIQQQTPAQMLGKIMSYVLTLAMCAQPLGQAIYGFLFDFSKSYAMLIVFVTAVLVVMLGVKAKSTCSLFPASK